MRVFTIINGYTGALCLQELVDQGHQVVGVVTAPHFPADAPPEETVIGVATRHLIPLYLLPYEVVAEPDPAFLRRVSEARPDLIVSMHYPVIFKQALLDIPPLGCVNIHPSKLPQGRGMTPSWWYLYLGHRTAWTALHYLDAGVDTGDVIAYASTPIRDEDTGETVSRRLSEAAHEIFREYLPAIAQGTAPRQKQTSRGSYVPAGKDWYQIRWTRSAAGIRGQIRCFTGTSRLARTTLAGKVMTINDARLPSTDLDLEIQGRPVPGQLLAILGEGLLVQTGRGRILLTDFTIEGVEEDTLRALLETPLPIILGS